MSRSRPTRAAHAIEPTVYVVWRRERSGKPWVKVISTTNWDQAAEAMEAVEGEALLLTVRDPRLVLPGEDNSGEPRRPNAGEDAEDDEDAGGDGDAKC